MGRNPVIFSKPLFVLEVLETVIPKQGADRKISALM